MNLLSALNRKLNISGCLLAQPAHLVQANQIASKCFIMLNTILPISCIVMSEMCMGNKIPLYKTVLRPILFYCAHSWGSAVKTNLQKIKVVQNKTLRDIVHCHGITGIPLSILTSLLIRFVLASKIRLRNTLIIFRKFLILMSKIYQCTG